MIFFIQFRPGAAWLNGKTVYEQRLQEHGWYMQKLFDSHKVILGGPFIDNTGGIVIVEVDNEEELHRILCECPSVIDRIFQAEAHPLHIVFDRSCGLSLRSID